MEAQAEEEEREAQAKKERACDKGQPEPEESPVN